MSEEQGRPPKGGKVALVGGVLAGEEGVALPAGVYGGDAELARAHDDASGAVWYERGGGNKNGAGVLGQ